MGRERDREGQGEAEKALKTSANLRSVLAS